MFRKFKKSAAMVVVRLVKSFSNLKNADDSTIFPYSFNG